MKTFFAFHVVQTDPRGIDLIQEWNGHSLLSLGHPASHVLQSRPSGLRLRRLGTGSNPIEEIPNSALIQGKEVDLGNGRKLRVRGIAMGAAADAEKAEAGTSVSVFTSIQNWILECRTLSKQTICARAFGTDALELTPSGSGSWNLKALVDGVSDGSKPLSRGEMKKFTSADLITARIEWSGARWTFAYSSAPEMPAEWAEGFRWQDLLGWGSKNETLDLREFRRASLGALGAVAALIMIVLLWPKAETKEDELIPAQFAHVVMRPAAAASSSTQESGRAAPKKAQETAVAQAFRSKALTSAVSGLLKGGMSKLLAQSNLMVANPSQSRGLFGSKSSLETADVRSAATAPGEVKIAAWGGTGAAVYGKGESKGVTGQGGGQVSLDLSDSVVEEGLTKDEVGEVIHKHLSEIRYCYETSLMRVPDLEGKMMSSFVINGGGIVRSSSVKSSTLNDARLEDCILRRLASWKFPKPKGGVDVPVTYPFVFKALGR